MCIIDSNMKEDHAYYETLITRYLSGETTKNEVSELLLWLQGDSANLNVFMEMRKIWFLQYAHIVEQVVDLDEEWKAMYASLDTAELPVTRKLENGLRRYFIGAAAIVLLLVVPTLIYFLVFMQPTQNNLFAEGRILESTLPDGTQVTLNTGSVLYYPSYFKGKERIVSLEGEAFFDVTHIEEKAFVINANEMQIRVLGTSFYVNTQTDENTMVVTLISGSVELNYNNKEILLEPGEKAVVLRQSDEILVQENMDLNLLAWKTKTLRFNDTPLFEIINVLKKVYNKDIIVLTPEINNCRITATFEGQSLEAVLLVLQSTIDITARPNGDRIELSGKECQ